MPSRYSMDAFDQLFWVSAAFVLILILKQDRPRLWLLFGFIAGLGVLTKITMLYFGLAVFVALLLTPARRYLFTPWPAGMDRRRYMEVARPR